jgi:hypothetical protein
MRRTICLLALLAATACSPSTPTPAANGAPPVVDGFDYQPLRAIEPGEAYTFTAKAHATDGATLRYEWDASAGELSSRNEATTSWRTFKPGDQYRPGRVIVELHVVGNGPARGGSVYLTIGADGRASVDGWVPNAYADTAGPTPAPLLSPPPAASPLPPASTEPLGSASP